MTNASCCHFFYSKPHAKCGKNAITPRRSSIERIQVSILGHKTSFITFHTTNWDKLFLASKLVLYALGLSTVWLGPSLWGFDQAMVWIFFFFKKNKENFGFNRKPDNISLSCFIQVLVSLGLVGLLPVRSGLVCGSSVNRN